jgi:hypothetical protein
VEGAMIHPEVLERLPEPARQKLLLIESLSDEALDLGSSAQTRLNDLARKYPSLSGDSPNVARLAAAAADADHRRAELHSLISSCVRWVKSLSPDAPLDVIPTPAPMAIADGETPTPEEIVTKIRSRIGELTIERLEVQKLPEPKSVLKQRLRAQVAKLAEQAKPVLQFDRNKADVAVFADPKADFGLSPGYLAGMLAWLDGDRLIAKLDEMIDAAIDDTDALTSEQQAQELAELSAQIEVLGRQEEALIEAAFAQGVDVLRRARADPACVLGVRARIAAPVARARARPVRESAAAQAAAE